MKLAMAQIKNEGSIGKNLAKCLDAIQKSAEQGADLILFPEVHVTEFFPQYRGQNVDSYGIEIDLQIVEKVRSEKPYTTLCRTEWYK